MASSTHLPIMELTRGTICESVHFGSIAVVDSRGTLLASYGNPDTLTFLRSSAKPFQALPLIINGGHEYWGISKKEIAITCASHIGSDDHAQTVASIQKKIAVTHKDLLCGIHPLIDRETKKNMRKRGEEPTQNRHNCSGKHTGMLALARMLDLPITDYINPKHPVQTQIIQTFSALCDVNIDEIIMGTDGCSAPNFAVPLRNAALGFARLCDPVSHLDEKIVKASQIITDAMMSHPDMVSGNGRFDTRIMEVASGKIVSKGGAEGYQCLGIMPNTLGLDSPGIGIAIKISDGDLKSRVRPAVSLEILRQLGALVQAELNALSEFGPRSDIKNWRNLIVGTAYPTFKLDLTRHSSIYETLPKTN